MNRPYEKVPLIALIILIQEYSKLVKDNFNMQKDLEQMEEEIKIRFNIEDDKQITIDDYLRSRKNESN